MGGLEIPGGPEELTPEWLTAVLRANGGIANDTAVIAFDAEPIGEGAGFIGLLARLHLRYDGDHAGAPRTLIAKFPSPAEGARTIGKLYGLYEREVRFYSEIAKDLGVYVPRCYHSAMDIDADRYFLLLEDLAASGRIGDQVLGCLQEEALLAIGELASFHGAWWDSPRLDRIVWLPRGTDLVRASMQGLYPQASQAFMQLFADRLTREIAGAMDHLGERILIMLPQLDDSPQTIVHADFRLDNLFFGSEGAPYRLAVIDWQGPNRSIGGYDLAYFISGCMPPERRRSCEMHLIQKYHEGLLERGVRGYPFERLLDDYRRSLLVALAITVVSGATLEITNERAVQLWEVVFDGLVASITDTNALELLPSSA